MTLGGALLHGKDGSMVEVEVTETETETGTEDSGASEAAQSAARGSIVVGHDGSPGADQALGEALDLARALGVAVVVVRAWSLATAPRPAGAEFGYVSGIGEYAGAVRLALTSQTDACLHAFPDVPVELRVVHAGPAKSLVEISHDARMLVVGARGLGGLAGMLLGSVSDQCVRHAACPVLVVKVPT
jgi:nucleotide-binding universal stress UspA family protein